MGVVEQPTKTVEAARAKAATGLTNLVHKLNVLKVFSSLFMLNPSKIIYYQQVTMIGNNRCNSSSLLTQFASEQSDPLCLGVHLNRFSLMKFNLDQSLEEFLRSQ
jgi:hypothetical protein